MGVWVGFCKEVCTSVKTKLQADPMYTEGTDTRTVTMVQFGWKVVHKMGSMNSEVDNRISIYPPSPVTLKFETLEFEKIRVTSLAC